MPAVPPPKTVRPPRSGLEALRRRFPWPEKRPETGIALQGWLGKGNRILLSDALASRPAVVAELGSWLGRSALFFAETAPQATLIAIDHWEGSPEHQRNPKWGQVLPRLHESFLMHLWDHRDRVIPLRSDSVAGLRLLHELGVEPGLIYVDASHETEAVLRDLEAARGLFPRAVLVGDDWRWPSVRVAVEAFAKREGLGIEWLGNCWRLVAPGGPRRRRWRLRAVRMRLAVDRALWRAVRRFPRRRVTEERAG